MVGPKLLHPPFQATGPSVKPINDLVFKDSCFENKSISTNLRTEDLQPALINCS